MIMAHEPVVHLQERIQPAALTKRRVYWQRVPFRKNAAGAGFELLKVPLNPTPLSVAPGAMAGFHDSFTNVTFGPC